MTEPRPSDPELTPDMADILVEINQWQAATPGEIIATDALGSCIGAAVYDPVTGRGYVAHSRFSDLGALETMVGHITSAAAELTGMEVWLAGGQRVEEGGFDDLHESAVDLFTSQGFAAEVVHTEWSAGSQADGDETDVAMVLDTATGRCEITERAIESWDLFDDIDWEREDPPQE